MSDSLPNASVPGPLSEADRDARIEQLLLSGLDHYFAGRYERAINIWTRVSFLERGHGRARAYIDRARGALAERQREADELVHAGVEAYHAGELQAARDLLTRATDAGGSSETAMLFIDRIRRADATADLPALVSSGPGAPVAPVEPAGPAHRVSWSWTIACSVVVAAGILLGSMRVASWLAELPIDAPPQVSPAAPESLPIVRASDMSLARAAALFESGRAADALRALDAVDIGDPRRPDADRLRAGIQRALLAGRPEAPPLRGEAP
jgi:D-serine deaminase-like pyridoxal phosphate-dependent protein